MTERSQQVRKHLLLGCALAAAGHFLVGCEELPESTFVLANDSRLPKWIAVPPGSTRANVKLNMNYYIKPWGSKALFSLQGNNKQILEKVNATVMCKKPFQVAGATQEAASGYPLYQAVAANGLTEIIEHKKMEPRFYVTDNVVVWKQYRTIGCG